MSIIFDESLKTGNELIDGQHQELINRVNKLTEALDTSKDKVVAVQTLHFLMEYVDFHFADEEKLQAEAGYPELAAHKELHDGFKKSVDELLEMLEEEEGPSEAFVAAVNKNVVDWLMNHIQICDKKVAEFVKG